VSENLAGKFKTTATTMHFAQWVLFIASPCILHRHTGPCPFLKL